MVLKSRGVALGCGMGTPDQGLGDQGCPRMRVPKGRNWGTWRVTRVWDGCPAPGTGGPGMSWDEGAKEEELGDLEDHWGAGCVPRTRDWGTRIIPG